MNNHSTGVVPPIVTVVRSPRWTSQVRRGIEALDVAPRLHWLLDLEAAHRVAISNHHAVLIVECQDAFPSKPASLLDPLAGLCNNAQNAPVFLLGDESIEPWRKLLIEGGAVEVCTSILDFEKMWQRVIRHLKISTTDDLTVEQTVAGRLPW